MTPFTKSYYDCTPTDIVDICTKLENHPAIDVIMTQSGMTRTEALNDMVHAWRKGMLEPVHDMQGGIIAFKPVDV